MPSSSHALTAACALLASGLGLAFAGQTAKRAHPVARKPAAAAQAAPATPLPGPNVEAIRQNNIGIAQMDRRKFADALGNFQRACVLDPQSDTGCLNMGIALLNIPHYDDAARVLNTSAEHNPQNPRIWFNLGLLERASGRTQSAAEDFEKAASLDAADADTQYFLGYLASEAGQYDQAAAAFKRAIEIDPLHASAEYGLAQAEQHLGDADGAKAHLERFRHITTERLRKPIRFLYGEQGKYSLAEEMSVAFRPALPAIPVQFVNVTSLSGLPAQPIATAGAHARVAAAKQPGAKTAPEAAADDSATSKLAKFLGSGACVFDYDGDGRPDIFLVNADGKGNAALYRNTGKGTFTDVTKAAKLEFHGAGMGCAVGDYDNDGHPDLAVTSGSGVTLLHNEGNGTFKDVTDEAGVRTSDAAGGLALGATFVDYDGDGDLDLYVARFNDFPLDHPQQPFSFPEDAPAPGNTLWRNQGNGKFLDWTKELGLAGSAPSVGAIGTDTNKDGAVDLVVNGWQKSPAVLVNEREGPFRSTNPWAIAMPGPAAGAVALDIDGDGWMDLAFTHWAPPGMSVWRNVGGKSFERVPLASPKWMRGWGIAALDYDNDGRMDLVAVGENFAGEGRIVLLRNEGSAGFRDVTHETGLDKIILRNPRSVIAFDYDGDGSTDLLITQNNLPPVLLKNVGGNKNNWLELAVTGDPDNKLGIGTRIEVFSGAQHQTWEVPGASGYLSQGPAEMVVGLGTEGGADVIKLHWPSGLLQDEIQIPGGKHAPIAEAEPGESPH